MPWETMSAAKNRIYVLVGPDDKLKSVVMFDKDGKRGRQIDLDHFHNKTKPHIHEGYEHSTVGRELMPSEKSIANKAVKIWEEYKR